MCIRDRLVTNPTMTIFIVVVMGGTTVVILKILKPTLNRLAVSYTHLVLVGFAMLIPAIYRLAKQAEGKFFKPLYAVFS